MSNQKPSSPKSIPPTLQTRKARQLYEKRLKEGRNGNAEQDWEEARQYLLHHPQSIFLWRLKQGVVRSIDANRTGFKKFINFVWKGLPTSEWVKLLAAPILLSIVGTVITNSFQEQSRKNEHYLQEQSRQNETINKYFEQMEQLIVKEKIDFAQSKDSVKTLIKGKSLATLRSVDNSRKEIVLSFLSESDLLNSSNDGISLSYFNLEQINLSGFNLTGINLKNAVLVKANLEGSLLEQANLSNANLNNAILISANLNSADLNGAILSDADLNGAILSDADLSGAILSDADLSDAILISANLISANLISANLNGANLIDADFNGANLNGANLRKTVLFSADNLTHAQIKSACNWEEAVYTALRISDHKPWIVEDKEANQKAIDKIKQDKASNPQTSPDCRNFSP